MIRSRLLSLLLLSVVAASVRAEEVVIDTFDVGVFSVSHDGVGSASVSQTLTGLDVAEVLGGQRRVTVSSTTPERVVSARLPSLNGDPGLEVAFGRSSGGETFLTYLAGVDSVRLPADLDVERGAFRVELSRVSDVATVATLSILLNQADGSQFFSPTHSLTGAGAYIFPLKSFQDPSEPAKSPEFETVNLIQLRLQSPETSGGRNYLFGDFRISAIPEPTSLLLLGSVLVGCLFAPGQSRRRR